MSENVHYIGECPLSRRMSTISKNAHYLGECPLYQRMSIIIGGCPQLLDYVRKMYIRVLSSNKTNLFVLKLNFHT